MEIEMSWLYLPTQERKYEIGFFIPPLEPTLGWVWMAVETCDDEVRARRRVHYLNGGDNGGPL